MLIVESLLLLLTEDSGRPEGWSSDNDLMLRGALLSDLMLAGRIEADTARTARRPRMRIVDATPTGHPVLDDALAVLSAKNGKRISSALTWDDLRPHDAAGTSLVKAGVLTKSTGATPGAAVEPAEPAEPAAPTGAAPSAVPVFPTRDPRPEAELRERLYGEIAGTRAPDAQDSALLTLLQSTDAAWRILRAERTGLRRSGLAQRIKEIAEQAPVTGAIKEAIASISSAVGVISARTRSAAAAT
ncbi:GOLPH3/VPS74 family protein [Actinomyces marmotae]|uniref:GOLPH3/VPS74 family protein n=1 Tax=Actinomyces marmotae TaxID=2737173 RepID=UPI00135799FD|nr:GPP34 family phosphoprotein [Actinomyces marmotae]